MNKNLKTILFLGFFSIFGSVCTAEQLYPGGYNITSDYYINNLSVAITDTLVITRKVENNEAFQINGLYFSENLPREFRIVSGTIKLIGDNIEYLYRGGVNLPVVPSCSTHYWVVDFPGDGQTPKNTLNPGDSITFELKIVSDEIGNFTLPLHTTVFYGTGTAFFSSSDPVVISVELSVDADEADSESDLVPENSFMTTAMPNPFNGSITLKYSGDALNGKQVKIGIYNILGQLINSDEAVSAGNGGQLTWTPDGNMAQEYISILFQPAKSGAAEK